MKNCLKTFGLLSLVCIVSLCCTKGKTSYAQYNYQPTDTTGNPNDTTKTTNPKFTYMALGDSYTIGQSVQVNERFPAQTTQILLNDSIKIQTPEYIAATGWTTLNLLSAINQQKPLHNYDIVTLLIGVNDQYQRLDTGSYRIRFSQLLDSAIAFAANKKSRVFVLSIPDYSVTPFVSSSDKTRVSMEIDWFNNINKQITLQKNVSYIDITPSTRQGATDITLIANDGLHPSGKEYSKWANLLAPLIKNVLK